MSGGISNEELVRKAVITTDAIAAAGKLNPAQSDRFIDFVINETVLGNNARMVRFRNEQLDIDKIGVGQRVAMPKAEATDPGLRRGVNTSKVTLQPSEIMVPFEISDTFADVNIEGDDVEEHIIRMMATQAANDIEELYILGDTTGPSATEELIRGAGSATNHILDTFLQLQDGWQRLADDGNIIDAEGQNIGLSLFGQLIRALPTKFRRNKGALRWFMSSDLWQLYLEKVTTRATALGDSVAGGATHKPFGITPVEVPLWGLNPKVVEHATLDDVTPVQLRYAPVQSVVVTPQTLAGTPTTPYPDGSTGGYILDAAAGTLLSYDSGSGLDGVDVKITYESNPQIILTQMNNFIVGIGRDIRIEKDRDIFKGVNQYAITLKVSVEYEEDDAIAKAINVGTGV
jgi:hypothetical protein